ncbi:hypothetical protein DOTSEDRAFT_71168 [Dothistroma septosporum NZE10]|uniref:Retinoic acid induced 16-like protein n=1 Tax=Dothistroma septosporum (strain NZE10 / CBS 128990) TaxID=675120 RepID=N1PSK1_DOTSN|nr:hypothetical protein DOTSEDRAFT_71168 [Dothistroma septosporum NZE10]
MYEVNLSSSSVTERTMFLIRSSPCSLGPHKRLPLVSRPLAHENEQPSHSPVNNDRHVMDFWARLIGSAYTPKPSATKAASNDPSVRLGRLRRVYKTILELCERPRDLGSERSLLHSLHIHIERLATLLRDETRAPVPHACLHFASANKIYGAIARAAIVSQYVPVIRSTFAVFAALVDSEEEDFLASEHFAKHLMKLVRKVLESGNVLVDTDTETAILELLFTITAKIRLQPEILPVWFQSTAKPELEDVFVKEKKTFVGLTQKDDFPLCYLMIDRVHHEGRIGDFARTGLLYVFEATGRSLDLEAWVVSSDLATLMASGLGALYSQLSRELSILHPDASLPPVLAMSDYTTTHTRANAESAFSERHQTHMATFLSYLAFWQDVLDHCRSADVKQSLLDHFQILFLQQLLYPSLLQSSDTDAGSSIAVLTYMATMLEALEYPDLIHMIMSYLLAVQESDHRLAVPPMPQTTVRPSLSRSPTSVRRRQSLMLHNTPKDADDTVDPNLFSLVDLIINNTTSRNDQSVFAALRLTSTIIARQKRYAFGTLLKVQTCRPSQTVRSAGSLELELEQYSALAIALHHSHGTEATYARLCEDLRYSIEAQVPCQASAPSSVDSAVGIYCLTEDVPLMRTMRDLLRTFFTNSIDVNLALTQGIITIAQCVEIRLDGWCSLSASNDRSPDDAEMMQRPWQKAMDSEERHRLADLKKANSRPVWSRDTSPMLHLELQALTMQLESVRTRFTNLDQLLAGRKVMLEATSLDVPGEPASMEDVHKQSSSNLDVSESSRGRTRSSSNSSQMRGRNKANTMPPQPLSSANPRAASQTPSHAELMQASTSPPGRDIFRPPPPETPSTTDVLMQKIEFPRMDNPQVVSAEGAAMPKKSASLNHVLTNVVILQEFVLELVAVMQVRATVLGDREVRVM